MQNNDLNVHGFQGRNPRCSPKSDRRFCFLTLTLRKKKWKKYVAMEQFSEKTEPMHEELKERAEGATSSSSAAVNFWYYIYSVLVTKNH